MKKKTIIKRGNGNTYQIQTILDGTIIYTSCHFIEETGDEDEANLIESMRKCVENIHHSDINTNKNFITSLLKRMINCGYPT